LALTAGALALLSPAGAQAPALQPREGEEAVKGGLQDEPDRKEKTRLDELKAGKKSLTEDPDPKSLFAKAGKWYAYRLTWPMYQGQAEEEDKKASGPPRSIGSLMAETQRQLLLAELGKRELSANQSDYLREFSKELTKALREVLSENSKPIVRINAVRMLAGIAEARQEEVVDTLIDLIRNPRENDAVKRWAFKGLTEFYQGVEGDRPVFKDPKREARTAQALIEYIARKPDLPEDKDQVEAIRFVRREAVRALAGSRSPSVPSTKADEGRTALWLLRVARKDGVVPEPSLSEQLEAAIGACQLRPKLGKDYQADFAAYHVGAVAVEFVNQANLARQGNSSLAVPWKLYAARLTLALDELKANAKELADAKAAKYVTDLAERAQTAVRPVWDGKDGNPVPLDDWLRKNPPPSNTVYKGVADSGIKPTEAGGN
jgi:hypothetical protein